MRTVDERSVRSDEIVHCLTTAALDFDVFAWSDRMLFDLLEQAAAAAAAYLDPLNRCRSILLGVNKRT
jgi:hypothetical protein